MLFALFISMSTRVTLLFWKKDVIGANPTSRAIWVVIVAATPVHFYMGLKLQRQV